MIKNFTVIGNILFCHINITRDVPSREYIAGVPPAIVNRLLHYSNGLIGVSSIIYRDTAISVRTALAFSEQNGYYLISYDDIDSSRINYLIGFYFLKDI